MQGTQGHLNFLPEKQTDFIFTMIAEEFGLVGGLVVMGLLTAIVVGGMLIALRCRHHYGRLLALGIATNFFMYCFVNLAMVMGAIPVGGVPLPLISHGGSAMLTVMFGMGLADERARASGRGVRGAEGIGRLSGRLGAWRQTEYRAGEAVAWIGRRSASVERLLEGRPGVFVTAWNPWGRLAPPGRNRRMARALQGWLRRVPHWPGCGVGRGWAEEHVLVRADPRRVRGLARRFRQAGIVVVAPLRPARLLLLPARSAACAPPAARWPVRPSARPRRQPGGSPGPRS